jgi:hypothetical protein
VLKFKNFGLILGFVCLAGDFLLIDLDEPDKLLFPPYICLLFYHKQSQLKIVHLEMHFEWLNKHVA